jgi:hypothetical protein
VAKDVPLDDEGHRIRPNTIANLANTVVAGREIGSFAKEALAFHEKMTENQ